MGNLSFQTIPVRQEDLEFIRSHLWERTGIHLSERKKDLVEVRLRDRLEALGFTNFSQYTGFLAGIPSNHPEWQNMINELTTNKTDFFREPAHFEYLIRNFLPAWEHRRKSGEKLGIWSAACATGEEPSTLSMVLDRYFQGTDSFRILATDLDTSVLSYASNAVYPREKLNEIPVEYRERAVAYGSGDLADWGKIRKVIREKIDFAQCNLTSVPDSISGPFDVIFCRNVFIYFKPTTIGKVVTELFKHAKPGAILLIGHAETLHSLQQPWTYVAPSIYTKA